MESAGTPKEHSGNVDDAALEAFEERALRDISEGELDDLIALATAEGESTTDALKILARSAAGVGAQAAYIAMEEDRKEAGMTSIASDYLQNLSSQLNCAIMLAAGTPVADALAEIRAPLVKHDKQLRQAAVSSHLTGFEMFFGLDQKRLSEHDNPEYAMTTFHYLTLGILSRHRHEEQFLGWLTKEQRSPLRCPCQVCIGNDFTRWAMLNPEQKVDGVALIAERYAGDNNAAFTAFGEFIFNSWADRHKQLTLAASLDHGANPVAASELAHTAFARMMGKLNDVDE